MHDSIQDQHRNRGYRDQRATFHDDDDGRFILGLAEDGVRSSMSGPQSQADQDGRGYVYRCDERPCDQVEDL